MLLDDAITDFGNSLDIPGLALKEDGKIALGFESLGTLFLERVESENFGDSDLLVYLARDHGVPGESLAAGALEACHYEAGHAVPVNAGIAGDNQLVFATRLGERDVTLASLESALQMLVSLHDSMKAG
ncbi:MAG: CesT family type III secretion system chaperone [Verrucomicrobiota bacterium]